MCIRDRFYMAMTQTKDMYDTFKENGFSDATTAIGMGAALYGFNKLFMSSVTSRPALFFGKAM